MELIKVIEEYVKATYGNFPGNGYWAKKFEDAYKVDTERAVGLKNMVMPKIAEGNILNEQARHYLGDCLNELKYSRPAWEQKLIHTWINEWNAQKIISLGDTWTANDILGEDESNFSG